MVDIVVVVFFSAVVCAAVFYTLCMAFGNWYRFQLLLKFNVDKLLLSAFCIFHVQDIKWIRVRVMLQFSCCCCIELRPWEGTAIGARGEGGGRGKRRRRKIIIDICYINKFYLLPGPRFSHHFVFVYIHLFIIHIKKHNGTDNYATIFRC